MEQVSFIVDGNKLAGTIIRPSNAKKKNPAILFVHGWTSAKERSYQYAKHLAEMGYLSFLFDMRGHGQSEGNLEQSTSREFLDDVLAAYDYMVTLDGVDAENISVVGSSFGSYLSALLTQKRKVRHLVLRVPADYSDDYFDMPKMQTTGKDNSEVIVWRKEKRSAGDTFALTAVSKFSGDVLVIESGKDTTVPHQTVANYADVVADKTRLTHVVIEDAPHSIKEGPFKDKTEQIIVDWFKKF